MKQNSKEELSLLHCDFVMAAGMIHTTIEAAMYGECTAADIGNSLSILKEFMDRRVERLEMENRNLHGVSRL